MTRKRGGQEAAGSSHPSSHRASAQDLQLCRHRRQLKTQAGPLRDGQAIGDARVNSSVKSGRRAMFSQEVNERAGGERVGDGKGVKHESVGRQESDPEIGLLVVDSEMQEGSNPREGCLYEKYAIFTEEIKTDCSLLRLRVRRVQKPCPGRPAGSCPIHLLQFLRSQRLFSFPFLLFCLFLPSEPNAGCRTGRMERGRRDAGSNCAHRQQQHDSSTPRLRPDSLRLRALAILTPTSLLSLRIIFSHRFHE